MTFSFGRADDDEISEIQVVAAVVSGTPLKFNPVTGTDTIMQGGVQFNINPRHQVIRVRL